MTEQAFITLFAIGSFSIVFGVLGLIGSLIFEDNE